LAKIRKVVVTGLGTINPLGSSVAESWNNSLNGVSGISLIKENWDKDLPIAIAGSVKDDMLNRLSHLEMRRLDRAQQFALVAFREAWKDSGVKNFDPERLGVSMGVGVSGALTFKTAIDIVADKGINRIPPFFIPMTMPNGAAATIALASGALAGAQTLVSACASGSEAIANGLRAIQLNEADIVICGGTEASITPLTAAGFTSMRALSLNPDPLTASRPFDSKRDGFVLAEGCGILILESEEHARGRAAKIYGEIVGASISSEGHHVVQPDPEGTGPARSMSRALKLADVSISDVCHVNAHATSTVLGDLAEVRAIQKVFTNNTDRIVVSATKSMTGHLIAGAGALESIFTILALRDGLAPPSLNIHNLDPEININIATNKPKPLVFKGTAINNSFGFGGHNVSLVFAPV
jgi:3-oxoacyl-[acyl-carrier-protein] synthase II